MENILTKEAKEVVDAVINCTSNADIWGWSYLRMIEADGFVTVRLHQPER